MKHRCDDRSLARSILLRLTLLVVVALAAASPAGAGDALKGVALVIGNGDYENLPKLANPPNDAEAIGKLFDRLGFETEATGDRNLKRLKRDLEDFVEDAEGADVAVLYYSGHGIEAGGENFLVPVDADLSSLDDAGEKLVPLNAVVARLQKTVPVVIVLLDACRTDPFPPGSAVRLSADAAPVEVSASGLGEARGVVPLAAVTDDGRDNLGTVIGFSAAPGRAALDGEPGGNSPYSAAVLKHLDAMSGEEFGTVMRMVAEEVYLKTGGRQRPWVNESLRRLLYFGKAVPAAAGEEGDILRERRDLLLTIADLPDADRRQIETVAGDAGVPMDALYGMLKALGADTPKDPAELEKLLRTQTERLKAMMADQTALSNADPEIQRLSKLADEAIGEGALKTAIALNERAKARLEELASTLDKAEADLKARRIEAAEVYARSARAYELSFDYAKAAEDYGQAFGQVERWDDRLALKYRHAQMKALTDFGDYKGDNDALLEAVAVGRSALELAGRLPDRDGWARTQNGLANALWTLGRRRGDAALLEETVAAYRAVLEVTMRDRAPLDWAAAQNNLGVALATLGGWESGTARLDEAVTAYRAALEERTRERVPLDWAMTESNLASALQSLAGREEGTERLKEAIAVYRAILEERTRERAPLDWAATQNNLGNALELLAEREGGTDVLEESIAAFRAALEEWTRERVPLQWASAQNNLGNSLWALGIWRNDPQLTEESVTAYRAALEERTRERTPLDWASTQHNLGISLMTLAGDEADAAHAREAVAAFRDALAERTRERTPLDWAATQSNLGMALNLLGQLSEGEARLRNWREAIEAWQSTALVWTRQAEPLRWAKLQNRIAERFVAIGSLSEGPARTAALKDAIAASRATQLVWTKEAYPLDWALQQNSIGYRLVQIGEAENDPARFEEAVPILRAALEVQSGRDEETAAYTSDSLCLALLELGRGRSDGGMLREARQLCLTAIEGEKAVGNEAALAETTATLARVEAALAEIR
jgi:uncharacterized caspase-like protein